MCFVYLLFFVLFSPGQIHDMNSVTVYDITNKFIAYSSPIPEVIGVFCEWGSLYLLTADKKVLPISNCRLNVYTVLLKASSELS